jgi:PAS domain S-box-containing protein
LIDILVGIIIGVGSMSGAGAGAWLVQRFCQGKYPLQSVRNVLMLVVAGALGGCMVSPTVGVLSLSLAGTIPWQYFGYSWLTWWVGDASGTIIIAPLILAWFYPQPFSKNSWRIIEVATLGGLTLLLCDFAFFRDTHLEYLLTPLLLWASFRFGVRGASSLAATIAIFATIGTSQGSSPFVIGTVNESLLYLHSFLSVTVISALFLAGLLAERKRAEADLAELQRQQERILTAVGEGLHGIDLDGKITFENPAAAAMLGWEVDELIGQPAHRLMHHTRADGSPYPPEECHIYATLRDGVVRRVEDELFWRKNGTSFPVTYTCTPIRNEAGEIIGAVVAFRDITDNLKLEEQLRQAQKMEAVGHLAGGVAHDFNNILSALLMQAELIGMVEHLPAEARDGLQEIRADIKRAVDLTRQLLLFSRRQVMKLQVLNLNELITNSSKLLQRLIREDVQLQLHLHAAPLITRVDAGMLEQVLMNLTVNARDAMPDGGRMYIETTEVTVAEETARLNPEMMPGRYVCLSVRDTGGGIPPEVLPQIFEPFFTTKETGKGTGLGLATVFGIVKQHQGWIKVDNRPGVGVTFQIFLPASPVTTAEPAGTNTKPGLRRGTETILLVEDELAVRQPTRRFLERHGYQVVEAADGMEALDIWQKNSETVSLLLTDLVMPGAVNGRELARRLVAMQPQLKVIYVSGYSADTAGREFELHQGEVFIQKPFATEHLLEAVRRCLDR